MKIYLSTLIIVSLIFGGCDISSSSNEKSFSSFSIETDLKTYTAPQRVEVSFNNNTNQSVLFAFCYTVLQRLENNNWSDYEGVLCPAIPMPPREIKAGEKFSQKLGWFSGEYEEGYYRVVFDLTDKDGEELPFVKRVTNVITFTN